MEALNAGVRVRKWGGEAGTRLTIVVITLYCFPSHGELASFPS